MSAVAASLFQGPIVNLVTNKDKVGLDMVSEFHKVTGDASATDITITTDIKIVLAISIMGIVTNQLLFKCANVGVLNTGTITIVGSGAWPAQDYMIKIEGCAGL